MIPNQRNALVLLLALLVCLAAIVETLRGRDWDLTVVLGIVAALLVAVLHGMRSRRQPISLRSDLATWLHEHAVATGEPPERLADRCVAAYRAGFSTRNRQ